MGPFICLALLLAGAGAGGDTIAVENEFTRLVLDGNGQVLNLIDIRSGDDYAQRSPTAPFAFVKVGAQTYNVSHASYHGGRITLAFDPPDIRAVLAVSAKERYLTFEVLSVSGEGLEELTFINVELALKGALEEPFAACALALNLQTNVKEIPGLNRRLRAMCYRRFGFEGAKAAVIACPTAHLRDVMKEVVRNADGLPQFDHPIGGPWAMDTPINRGSYLFDFGKLTEETADDWIALAKDLGINQIDFHTGHSLRFGDCRPNPDLFPNGRDSVKAVIDKLHAAGLDAGLHTYAFFLAKDTPWVTPVPDPRLGKDAVFTLAESIAAEDARVPVGESTEAMSTTTGFQVRNSVTIQIDDELITYAGVSKAPPYAFTECTRGACGTVPAEHAQGAKVYHLKECFGLFAPGPDSTLLAEVAAHTAETFNECGFDMIYLDALDGEDILAGPENAWHYGSKFVFEICNRLERPALFEMSTFHHHLWYVRGRMGAWDHPNRWHKRFVDVHTAANKSGEGMLLPMHLGWWAVKTWTDGPHVTQIEPTFPDDIEYLLCKCLGNGVGLSLMGVNPETIGSVPAYRRLAPIFRQYEQLRRTDYFDEDTKARLRVPGDEFTLEQGPGESWRFRPVQYTKHKVQGIDGWSNVWAVHNRFERQPLRLRIEALISAAPYDSTDAVLVEDFSAPAVFDDRQLQENVHADLHAASSPVRPGAAVSGAFGASSTREDPNGAWAKIGRIFSPPMNIAGQQALGLWVYGDGQGELLNIQLRSPRHIINGIGDHYVQVDFNGWRYFELIEPEGGHAQDFSWPYGGAYALYREWVDYASVESLSLWYNDLPAGKEVTCCLSPIKALPLAENTLRRPAVTIGDKTIVFPVELSSGQYIEFDATGNCKLYGKKGEPIADVTPEGDIPALEAGDNTVHFDCAPLPQRSARAYVSVITRGELID